MRIDGRAMAEESLAQTRESIAHLTRPPRCVILRRDGDKAAQSFVAMKRRAAERAGVVLVEEVVETEDVASLVARVRACGEDPSCDALVVQLPIVPGDPSAILRAIPDEKDADLLAPGALGRVRTGESVPLPPVAAAVLAMLDSFAVPLQGRRVLVLGAGRLVGAPVALLLRARGADVTVLDRPTSDLASFTRDADVIVSGVGVPGLLRSEHLSPGVVLIDAGTSESGGVVVGDADPSCEAVASLWSTTPGGVGPLAVALLIKNIATIALQRERAGER